MFTIEKLFRLFIHCKSKKISVQRGENLQDKFYWYSGKIRDKNKKVTTSTKFAIINEKGKINNNTNTKVKQTERTIAYKNTKTSKNQM